MLLPRVTPTRGGVEPPDPSRRGSGTRRAANHYLWDVSQRGIAQLPRKSGNQVPLDSLNDARRAHRSANAANDARLFREGTGGGVRRRAWMPLPKRTIRHACETRQHNTMTPLFDYKGKRLHGSLPKAVYKNKELKHYREDSTKSCPRSASSRAWSTLEGYVTAHPLTAELQLQWE